MPRNRLPLRELLHVALWYSEAHPRARWFRFDGKRYQVTFSTLGRCTVSDERGNTLIRSAPGAAW